MLQGSITSVPDGDLYRPAIVKDEHGSVLGFDIPGVDREKRFKTPDEAVSYAHSARRIEEFGCDIVAVRDGDLYMAQKSSGKSGKIPGMEGDLRFDTPAAAISCAEQAWRSKKSDFGKGVKKNILGFAAVIFIFISIINSLSGYPSAEDKEAYLYDQILRHFFFVTPFLFLTFCIFTFIDHDEK